MQPKRLALLALFIAALTAWFALDLGQYLTLDALKAQQAAIDQFYRANLIAKVDYADILYVSPLMLAVGVVMAAATAYVTLRLYVRN